MTTTNIVFLVIVLLFSIFGFIKGFKKKTIRTAALISGLIVAYFVGVPLSNMIMYTPFGNETVTGWFLKNIDETSIMIEKVSIDLSQQTSQISSGLSELKIPTLFHGFFISRVFNTSSTVRDAIATSFASSTFLAFFTIIFFIATYITIKLILKKTTDFMFSEDGNNLLGRVFGAIRGFVYASLLIIALMFIVVLINQIMIRNGSLALNNFLDSQLGLSSGSSFSLGKLYYNTAAALLNWISLI